MNGSQKEGVNFLNLLQKEGVPRKGGVPSEKGGSNPGGNYALPPNYSTESHFILIYFLIYLLIDVLICEHVYVYVYMYIL